MSATSKSLPFRPFPKIARLSRECIITEKIDGTNASILITEDGQFLTGSRNRWITPTDDNFGFSKWAHNHKDELMKLGPGHHFGEWWGHGIQRTYGIMNKRWSLFNVLRWCEKGFAPKQIHTEDPRVVKMQQELPSCCSLVPELYRGAFSTEKASEWVENLRVNGSYAVAGFFNPEGIVIYHVPSGVAFKKTLDRDELPKGQR